MVGGGGNGGGRMEGKIGKGRGREKKGKLLEMT